MKRHMPKNVDVVENVFEQSDDEEDALQDLFVALLSNCNLALMDFSTGCPCIGY